jgi:hypothetical protein
MFVYRFRSFALAPRTKPITIRTRYERMNERTPTSKYLEPRGAIKNPAEVSFYDKHLS